MHFNYSTRENVGYVVESSIDFHKIYVTLPCKFKYIIMLISSWTNSKTEMSCHLG